MTPSVVVCHRRSRLKKKVVRALAISAMVAAVTFSAIAGYASTMGGSAPNPLGSDGASLSSCDGDGVTVAYDTTFTDGAVAVSAVTVGGISDTCDGQQIGVWVTDKGGSSIGYAESPIPAAAATDVKLQLPETPSVESVSGVHVVIAGP